MRDAKFDPGRAVEIISRSNGMPHKMGTGYRVGGRLILTVAHIFPERTHETCIIRSRVVGNPENMEWTEEQAEVVWQDAVLDAALVALPESDRYKMPEDVVFGEFSAEMRGARVEFDMYGWPSWALTHQENKPPRAEGRQIWGVIAVSDYSSEGFLILEADRSGADWSGISGASVFCNGHLIGIQVQHQRPDRAASLSALSISKLLDNPEFAAVFGTYRVPILRKEIDLTSHQRKVHLPPASAELIGREAILGQIKDKLLNFTPYEPIVLMQTPGIGKSELSLYLLNDPDIRANFPDGVLWAALGKGPNITQELIKWSQWLGIKPEDFARQQKDVDRSHEVHRVIGDQRLLIFIDDVWKVEHLRFLLIGGPYCATILTTRRAEVASGVIDVAKHVPSEYVIERLSTDDGLALLTRLAPAAVAHDPETARELVEAVGGIPFGLVLMGKRLAASGKTGQSRSIRLALGKLTQAEERLKQEIQRGWYQPEDAPLSLEASILMSEDNLDPQTRRIFRAASIFRAKPKRFSLRALAEVCSTLDEFSETEDIQEVEDVVYTALQAIAEEGLLEFAPDPGNDSSEDSDPEVLWTYEQSSEKFAMPQVVVDYAYQQLSQDERITLHDHAAKYYQACLLNFEENGRNGEASAYARMYAYEDEHWQQVKASWLHHLSFAGEMQMNLAFTRLYFDAFFWWGSYLAFRPFSEEILEEWRAQYPAQKDRKWLNQVIQFHKAYPYGYQKRNRGDWRVVEESLLALRKLGEFDGELQTFEDNEELLHLRVLTNLYLSEARQYQDLQDTQADAILDEALEILERDRQPDEENDDAWLIPWVQWQHADLHLERGDLDQALEAADTARGLALEAEENTFDIDLETVANSFRVMADVFWQRHEVQKAFQYYTLAMCCAWGFHAAVNATIDFYTREFHDEMIYRIRSRIEELCQVGNDQEAERACVEMHDFWMTYWHSVNAAERTVDVAHLLQEKEWGALGEHLFPPLPIDEDIEAGEESAYYKRIVALFPNLFDNNVRAAH